MKTLGLLGGMSWESTLTYYRELNLHTRTLAGGLHSAPCILLSLDFAVIASLQETGDWEQLATILNEASTRLKLAGAEAIVLCTNTMHAVSGGIEEVTGLPLLHIADATAKRIVEDGFRTVGLLGTRFTMEKDFYVGRLREKFGLEVLAPGNEERVVVHDVIYEELCKGIVREKSRQKYREIIKGLVERGAECIILGCTEIELLIGEGECDVTVFDTTKIHARAAVEWALEE